jgi:STE24 endopeptidase
MNASAAVILSALLIVFLLNVTADRLNLRSSRREPPADLQGIYDPERYRLSQRYVQARTRFGWCRETVVLGVTLLVWFSGGFAELDRWVRSFGQGPVATGLICIGLLVFLRAALALPFAAYSTFVIERRFGFNRTDWGTFVADGVKTALLSAALGLPLTAGVLALFEHAGRWAWGVGWIGISAFMLMVQYVAPRWILPMFNTFTPLEDSRLHAAILELARSARFPLEQVFVLDGSRRSTKANAFFTGFGANRRVALFDTLVASLSVPQIVAVIAHEIGHFRKRHVLQLTTLSILNAGLVLFLFSTLMHQPEFFEAFGVRTPSVHLGLVFISIAYPPVDVVLGALAAALSRRNEFQADRFAIRVTRDGQALVEALRVLAARNLSNLTPHPLYVRLHYSHPPLVERIRAIQEEDAAP